MPSQQLRALHSIAYDDPYFNSRLGKPPDTGSSARAGSCWGQRCWHRRSRLQVAASETLWHELCEDESIKKLDLSTWAGAYAQNVRTRCNWQNGLFRATQWCPQGSREGPWVSGVYMFEGFIVLLQNVVRKGEQNCKLRLDVWDHATGAHLHELRSWWHPGFRALISGHRDRLVACNSTRTGAMHVWHIPSGRLLIHAVPDNPVPSVMRIEMNDTHLVTAYLDGNSMRRRRLYTRREIIAWDLFVREEVFSVILGYGYNRVNALFLDVNTIYGCFQESVCLWDNATASANRWNLVGMGWACRGALSENAVTDLDVFFAPVELRKGSRASRKDKFYRKRVLDGTEYLASPLVSLVACWPTICAIGTGSAVGMLTASPAANGV
eukprot:jgi/Chlat1/8296/Chrsp78S07736